MTRYQLRDAQQTDFEFLWALHVESYRSHIEVIWGWDEAWQRNHFEEEMADESHRRQVIEADGDSIGFLDVEHRDECLFVRNIKLSTSVQGRGLGSRIMGDLQEVAARRSVDVVLHVFRVNTRAAAFYERLGFVQTGESETHFKLWWSPSTLR